MILNLLSYYILYLKKKRRITLIQIINLLDINVKYILINLLYSLTEYYMILIMFFYLNLNVKYKNNIIYKVNIG